MRKHSLLLVGSLAFCSVIMLAQPLKSLAVDQTCVE
jgi:hypothetical protein